MEPEDLKKRWRDFKENRPEQSRQYFHRVPGSELAVGYDENYFEKCVSEALISSVETGPDDLLVFADESGESQLSDGLFGYAGCALLGRQYPSLKETWANIREKVFELPSAAETPFHAQERLRRLRKKDKRLQLTDFLRNAEFKRIGCFVGNWGTYPGIDQFIGEVSEGLENALCEVLQVSVPRDQWIFENSHRDKAIMMIQCNPRYPGAAQNGGVYFMKKDAIEPGLEIADLIAFVAGRQRRDSMAAKRQTQTHGELYEAIFGDRSNSRDYNI